MARRIQQTYQQIGDVARSAGVRRACAEAADRIAEEAAHISQQYGLRDVPIGREDGTRPKGRPYSRITMPYGQEWGTARQPRLMILGLAIARSQR